MGLTILAWGNSMGDLSADVTMARRGLTNMALTACFAGPVFNILIGLGAGFSRLASETKESESAVKLNQETLTGLIFIMASTLCLVVMGVCVLKGRIPKEYGYATISLYGVYVVTSVLLGFSSNF